MRTSGLCLILALSLARLGTVMAIERPVAIQPEIAAPDTRTWDEVMKGLGHENFFIRTSAYFALSGIGGDEALAALAGRLKTDHSTSRVIVVDALNNMGDKRAGDAELAFLDPAKESKEFCQHCLIGMRNYQVKEAAPKIIPMLLDDAELTRTWAANYFEVCPDSGAADGLAAALARQSNLNITYSVTEYLKKAALPDEKRQQLTNALKKYGKQEMPAQP